MSTCWAQRACVVLLFGFLISASSGRAASTAEWPDAGVFADANLALAVRAALLVAGQEPLSEAQLLGLVELDVRGRGISSLAGLERCANLRELTLWDNRVSDLAPLAGLRDLVYLDLDQNLISDLTPLAGLARLEVLYLSFNAVRDVTPLGNLASLRTLGIFGNEISDVGPLATLVGLRQLDIGWNAVVDIAPLLALVDLEWLDASSNPIDAPGMLAALPKLTALRLRSIGLRDLDPLATLAGRNLCLLDLSSNAIAQVDALAGLVIGPCERRPLLDLSSNEIADLSPLRDLVAPGGMVLDVRGNPLGEQDAPPQDEVVAQLRERGVTVLDRLPLQVGAIAPSFSLPRLGGTEVVTLEALRGKVVLLDFWASWCGPCRASMPVLDSLAADLEGEVVLIAVCLDQKAGDALRYLEENPMPHTRAVHGTYAEAAAVSLAYGDLLTNGIPHTFVIDRDGTIRYSGHPGELPAGLVTGLVGP